MEAIDTPVAKILSIDSHVVHGYVGNRAAVFPLQLLGFEVECINSVQLCGHHMYGPLKGQVLNADDLDLLYSSLKEYDLIQYDYVRTGYIGSESFLEKVYDIVTDLKKNNPNIKYVCDPVMGDDGVMYVPESLLPVYQDKILPLADILLPNQMEAEKLTERKITSEDGALEVIDLLHARGPGVVVLTSTNIGGDSCITGFASSKHDCSREVVRMTSQKIDATFFGTGDVFASLWLAWGHKHKHDVMTVGSKVLSTMHHLLQRTIKTARASAGEGNKPSWSELELKIIQSKRDIENPAPAASVEYIIQK